MKTIEEYKNTLGRVKTMREILFKAKRLDNGEWVYGDVQFNADCVKIREQEKNSKSVILNKIAKSYEVYQDTLCQYTGLEDKNGVKIFEGDLLKGLFYGFPCPENDYEFRVYWDDKTCGFQANYFEQKKCEVIGNIHDKEE